MKFPYFKALIIAGALVVAWSCSDEAAEAIATAEQAQEGALWVFNDGASNYYVSPNLSLF